MVSNELLDVPSQERKVQDQGKPVTVDKEEESKEAMDGSFGNDVRVEAVAKVDRVDIVTVIISLLDSS